MQSYPDISECSALPAPRQWLLDLDGRVVSLNEPAFSDASAGQFGDPRKALLTALWPESSRNSLARALAAAATGRISRLRTFRTRDNGSHGYWDTQVIPIPGDHGEPTGLCVLSWDVTDEIEQRALLDAVVEALPSPLSVHDEETGRIVLWNRAAEATFGIDREAVIGQSRAVVFHRAGRAFLDQTNASNLKFGETLALRGVRAPRAMGGGVYDVMVRATFDDLGARHVITLAKDVGERIARAQALEAAAREAERASQAKSTFLANISHEIRTPMNGVVACAELLARCDLPGPARELVDILHNSSVVLERLLGDMLSLATIEAGGLTLNPQVFHLGELLRTIEDASRLTIGDKALALSVEFPPELDRTVRGDPIRLRQVLGNLIGNAIKFTAEGSVRLTASSVAEGRVRFSVADTGIGFGEWEKALIFERFEQADSSITRRYGGSGLGLSISRELVALMGGALECDARPSEGATFWFSLDLPFVDAPPAARPRGGGQEERRPMRILLADDHPANRRVIELLLADVAQVHCVENGAEALQVSEEGEFDVVLMDVQMPVMDGLSAVREIRRRETVQGRLRTPIIMLTAHAGQEHLQASLEAGADLHIEKPINAQVLFDALRTATARVS